MAPPSTPTKIIRTAFDSSKVTLEDGTAVTPLTLDIKFLSGVFAINDLTADGREDVLIQSRGKLESLREGGLIFPKVSFSAKLSEIHETSAGTPFSWLFKLAPFTSRVSTFTSHSTRDHTTVIFTLERGATDQVFRCQDVKFDPSSFAEAEDGNTMSFSGTVYGDLLIDGVTAFTAPRT